MKKLVLLVAVLVSVNVLAVQAPVADGGNQTVATSKEVSNRSSKKWGTYLAILGDPAPTLAGINGAYNIKDYLRLHAGMGQVKATTGIGFGPGGITTTESTMTTIGAGALAMMPGWNLTPVAGLSYSHVFVSGTGFDVNADNVYATIGGDWQAASGFNLGVGLNIALTNKSVGGLYVNGGWFF